MAPLLGLVAVTLALAWPYLLGSWLAVQFGAAVGSTAAVVTGWVLEVPWLVFLGVVAVAMFVPSKSVEPSELAAANSPEARVADAACKAWEETLAEPSWSSPQLAATRASFDGQREVDAIIDVAMRIHEARKALGAQPPPGPARDYWQKQSESLDRSAMRLGERTDALVQHRDQASGMSAALVQLAELERLERSALWVDGVALETSARVVEPDVLPVADQIFATREAVNEIVEMMARTRAPLVDQEPPSLP